MERLKSPVVSKPPILGFAGAIVQAPTQSNLLTRSLVALAFLNFFLADARDGLGPFLDGFSPREAGRQ
ncbi:hypothetical protein [Rhizobium sp.]